MTISIALQSLIDTVGSNVVRELGSKVTAVYRQKD